MNKVYQFLERSPFLTNVGSELLSPKMDSLRTVPFLHPEQVDIVSGRSMTPAACGYPIDPNAMPTAVAWGSKNKPMPDVYRCENINIVSERIRDVIEDFEPGIHQFIPVELYRPKAKEAFARHYWMIICRRVDSVNARLTTTPRLEGGLWDKSAGGTIIFDLTSIGGAHLWCDPSLITTYTFCSEALGDALAALKPIGLLFPPHEAAP